ncbi:MAG: hypothetical protein ABL904_24910 [Hyphomicrobiaceae bacterium]
MSNHTFRSLVAEWTAGQGGTLEQKFAILRNRKFDDPDDARALCVALGHPRADAVEGLNAEYFWGAWTRPAWWTIAWEFNRATSDEARTIIRTQGIPQFRQRVAFAISENSEWKLDHRELDKCSRCLGGRSDHYLFILSLLAQWRDDDDIALTVRAARLRRFHTSGDPTTINSTWSAVFQKFTEGHPRGCQLLDEFRYPLPEGLVEHGYLEFCNTMALEGRSAKHPFDSDFGILRLQDLLQNSTNYQDAVGVAVVHALPQINQQAREQLLEIANKHRSRFIKMAACWIESKLKKPGAYEKLKKFSQYSMCQGDLEYYLQDLGERQ